MLQWVEATVPFPYGDVKVLHWAVGDDDTEEPPRSVTNPISCAEDELGAVLWNSNEAIMQHLHHGNLNRNDACSDLPFLGKSVVELGAGVGVLGIALALGGADVVVTDIKELLPLMQHNIRLNSSRLAERKKQLWEKNEKLVAGVSGFQCQAATLRWGDPIPLMIAELAERHSRHIDYVILCDALYGNVKDWTTLLDLLEQLTSFRSLKDQSKTLIINYCEQRINGVEDKFLEMLDSSKEQKGLWQHETTELTVKSSLDLAIRCSKIVYNGPPVCLRVSRVQSTSSSAEKPIVAKREEPERKRKRLE